MSEETLEALEKEAAAEPITFEFGGRSFTPVAKMDLRVLMALKREDMDRAIVLMLGQEQTDQLFDLDTDEALDENALRRLTTVWAQATGATSLGESKASTDS